MSISCIGVDAGGTRTRALAIGQLGSHVSPAVLERLRAGAAETT